VFRTLALQKESKILEGHLLVDHVHMLISIPSSKGEKGTSQAITFGPKVISCQQLAEMRRSFGNTSKNKRPKIDALTSCKCSKVCYLLGGHWFTTALSGPWFSRPPAWPEVSDFLNSAIPHSSPPDFLGQATGKRNLAWCISIVKIHRK
jgi:hypothetical protein